MNHTKAIGMMCLAVVCFSILDSTAKYFGEFTPIHLFQVLWLRFAVHTFFLALIYSPRKFINAFKTSAPKVQLLRTLSMICATLFNFWAVHYLQLDQTITIFFLSPLLVAALSAPILGEHLRPNQLYAVLFGFLGVLFVMRPGFGGIHWAVILSLLATLSVSIYNVLTRYTAKTDSNITNQIYSPIGGTILLAPPALYFWQTPEDITTIALLISLGVSGCAGHWLLITAHRYAPAPLLAPFIYVGILVMPIIGYYVFDDVITPWTGAGAFCVICSGLYLWYQDKIREERKRKQATKAGA